MFASDGNKYRIGQRVYMIDKNETLGDPDIITDIQYIDNVCHVTLKNNGIQKPVMTSKAHYKFVSGDVLTVSII